MINIVSLYLLSSLLWASPVEPLNVAAVSPDLQKLEEMLLFGLPASRQRQFVEARTAWRKYRDAECGFRQVNFPMWTSIEVCKHSMLHQRATDIRLQLRWQHSLPGNVR